MWYGLTIMNRYEGLIKNFFMKLEKEIEKEECRDCGKKFIPSLTESFEFVGGVNYYICKSCLKKDMNAEVKNE